MEQIRDNGVSDSTFIAHIIITHEHTHNSYKRQKFHKNSRNRSQTGEEEEIEKAGEGNGRH